MPINSTLKGPGLRPAPGYMPAAAPAGAGPLAPPAAFALFFFLFLTLSRFHEALTVMVGLRVYMYTIATALAVATLLLSGRAMLPWRTTPGVLLVAMTVWMIIGMPFGIWRGGTFGVIQGEWLPSLLTFTIIGAMPKSLRDVGRMMFVSGFSMIVVILMYQRFASVDSGGRVAFAFGTLGNSNDLALHLLFGLPFLFFVVTDSTRTMLVRTGAAATALVLLTVVVRTGSRSGLLGFAALVLAMFLFASLMQKLKLVVMAVLLVSVLVATAPQLVLKRYLTLVEDDPQNEAVQSTLGRKQLLEESIRQTFKRPIFGVGAGNFPVAYAKVLEDRGIMYHRYRESHNTYTEVSSELGIPGFFFFTGMLAWCFRQTAGLYRRARQVPGQRQVASMAFCLFLSLLTFSITTFFGSNAYRFYVPVLVGMTVALVRVSQHIRVGASLAPVMPWGRHSKPPAIRGRLKTGIGNDTGH